MADVTSYQYVPIQRNEIRLCQFSENGDVISTQFRTISIEAPLPDYHALSYVWSSDGMDPTKNWALDINGALLPALDSLQGFFRVLRSYKNRLPSNWWWIDSICINQTDLQERNAQVELMGRVYGGAQQTVVWLGDKSKDSDQAIEFIRLLHKMSCQGYTREALRVTLQKEQYQSDWAALSNFFSRRWWTRMWTLQEFALPGRVSFWCGRRRVSRTTMWYSLEVADKCEWATFKSTMPFYNGWNRRRLRHLHKNGQQPGTQVKLSLLALVAYCSNNEASDDRDRLYAFNGLASDFGLLEVDYSRSVEEVYFRFAKSFIDYQNSLDIICFSQLYDAPAESILPSWVPDWRQTVKPLVVPLMVSQSSKGHIGNLRPLGTWEPGRVLVSYAASGTKPAVFDIDGSTLRARGIVIDIIEDIMALMECDTAQNIKRNHSRENSAPYPALSSVDILTSVCRCLVLDRQDRYLRYLMPTEQFLQDFSHLYIAVNSGNPPPVYSEFHKWLSGARTLQIRGLDLGTILRYSVDPDTQSPHSPPSQEEYLQASFFGRFFDVVVRMLLRLMISKSGHLGMVPGKARKGDLICVLFGCSVPVILRRTGAAENQFRFVGECFLDGYMSGEVLEFSDFTEEMFCIV